MGPVVGGTYLRGDFVLGSVANDKTDFIGSSRDVRAVEDLGALLARAPTGLRLRWFEGR